MTQSEIFTAAHKGAKKIGLAFGNYAKRFKISLKAQYAKNKKIKKNEALKELCKYNDERIRIENFHSSNLLLVAANKERLDAAQLKCAKIHGLPLNHAFNLRFGYMVK